ncbi:MAG TPA: ribosome biogenesis GTPase Der [Acidimicrobiia bacterium]
MSSLPVVAVVGRPNVGKSTLVNRIIGSRSAVVEEMPGVTRDRRQFEADWAGRDFLLVDTGGWEAKPGDPIEQAIREQAEAALSGADVVLFVVDVTAELTDDDEGVAQILKRSGVPVIVVANKADSDAQELEASRMWSLGLGEPQAVSAYHGRGVGDLLDRVVAELPDAPKRDETPGPPRLAVVGRPNVGKSTLLNRLVGEERVIVSEVPGTTRDPIDVEVEIDGSPYVIVDTAGIRRKPQITEDADFYAVLRAREALASADVALMVLDATEGVTHQDQRIINEIQEAGAGLVLLLNKWDAIDEEQREVTERSIPDRLGFVEWAPLLRMSAKTGSRVGRLAEVLPVVLEDRARRIPTGELNRKVREWVAAHPPPVRKGRRPKIQYAVQAGTNPPTFVLFVSGGEIGDDYRRFLENRIRRDYEFVGTPIHIVARDRR